MLLSDYSCNLLVNAFFLNLLKNIERPENINRDWVYENNEIAEQKKAWYNEVINWAYKDTLWFSAFEVWTNYDSKRLRDKIIEKCREKIANL